MFNIVQHSTSGSWAKRRWYKTYIETSSDKWRPNAAIRANSTYWYPTRTYPTLWELRQVVELSGIRRSCWRRTVLASYASVLAFQFHRIPTAFQSEKHLCGPQNWEFSHAASANDWEMSSDWVPQLRLKDTEKWTQHNGNTDWRTEPEVFLKTGKSEKKPRKSVLKGCEFKLNMWKTWGFNPTNAIGLTIINSSRKETWNSDALATFGLFLSLLFAPSARPVQDPQWQKALQPARTHQGRLRSFTLNVSFSKTLKLHLSGCSNVSRKVDVFCGSSSIWQKSGNKLLCVFYCCKSNSAVWIQCLLLSRLPLIQDDTFISHLAMRALMESIQGKKLKQGIDMGDSQGLIIIFCSRDGLSSRMLLLCILLAILRSILKSVAASQPACRAKRNHVKMAGSIVWHSLQSCRR